jgi:hypothetical protein
MSMSMSMSMSMIASMREERAVIPSPSLFHRYEGLNPGSS